jgi:hypothetical protein
MSADSFRMPCKLHQTNVHDESDRGKGIEPIGMLLENGFSMRTSTKTVIAMATMIRSTRAMQRRSRKDLFKNHHSMIEVYE